MIISSINLSLKQVLSMKRREKKCSKLKLYWNKWHTEMNTYCTYINMDKSTFAKIDLKDLCVRRGIFRQGDYPSTLFVPAVPLHVQNAVEALLFYKYNSHLNSIWQTVHLHFWLWEICTELWSEICRLKLNFMRPWTVSWHYKQDQLHVTDIRLRSW
jgi:hypothetical protein